MALPMICANPDLIVIRGGREIICAGSLALRYEEIGGSVRWLGKPKAEIYEYRFRELADFDKPRIAAVGDLFRTDLAGAPMPALRRSSSRPGSMPGNLVAGRLTGSHWTDWQPNGAPGRLQPFPPSSGDFGARAEISILMPG